MLFGGKLTSILVCQACKHVSHTYEDFNDLSLSLKAEDYARERKRDKLKQLAKKLRNISGTALSVIPMQRSSSVPATPHRDSTLENPEVIDPHRRRSIDLADVEVDAATDKHADKDVDRDAAPDATPIATRETALEIDHFLPQSEPQPEIVIQLPPESHSPQARTLTFPVVETPEVAIPIPTSHKGREHIEISEPLSSDGREKREKSESWSKLGRRISESVGLSKQSREDRRRTKEGKKVKKDVPPRRNPDLYTPTVSLPTAIPIPVQSIDSPDVNIEREPTSLSAVNDRLQAQLAAVKRSLSPAQKSSPSPSASPTPRFPLIPQPPTPSTKAKRPKTPRPPSISADEAAYLRDILADISTGGAASPFSIFKQTKDQSSAGFSTAQNMFLKIPQLGGLEECLRLFTSVEVLDGENMVKCHRCWKIANGLYKPSSNGQNEESDSCSDDEKESLEDEDQPNPTQLSNGDTHHLSTPIHTDRPRLSTSTSTSSSATSLFDTPDNHDTSTSLASDITFDTSSGSHAIQPPPPSLELTSDEHSPSTSTPRPAATYGGLPIPLISTTAPESPMSIKTARLNTTESPISPTSSQVSLHVLTPNRDKEKHIGGVIESEGYSDDESGTSANLSAYSDVSSTVSPAVSPNVSQENLTVPLLTPSVSRNRHSKKSNSSGIPPSKQMIMRAAYKRYLIATPPPILVIHLKRFQQMSKTPIISFSSSFKKLEDYVSFPEYLDLAPYLAPKREQYVNAKLGYVRGRTNRPERCMYRLYAVVVHIGNMVRTLSYH